MSPWPSATDREGAKPVSAQPEIAKAPKSAAATRIMQLQIHVDVLLILGTGMRHRAEACAADELRVLP